MPNKNPDNDYVCQWCGKAFYRRGRIKENKYCSRACHNKSMQKYQEMFCMICGKIFMPKKQDQKCCSLKCGSQRAANSQKNRVAITCQVCGRVYFRPPSQAGKYCSITCKHIGGRNTVYPTKQARYHFRKLQKQVILERDGHRCILCNSTTNLHVDHILAVALGGINTLENGQTLCHECHKAKTRQDFVLIKANRLLHQ